MSLRSFVCTRTVAAGHGRGRDDFDGAQGDAMAAFVARLGAAMRIGRWPGMVG